MWESLDGIAWSGLRHHRGKASDVPGLFPGCAGDDEPRQALTDLDLVLFYSGGWISPAAVAALPFLIDLAVGEQPCRCRADVVDLVETLIVEGADLDTNVDPGWRPALLRETPRLLGLLDDPDPVIRRHAIEILAAGLLPADQTRTHLTRRWETETDPANRLGLVAHLGPAVQHALLDGDDLQAGLAALHALSETDPGLPLTRVPQMIAAVHDEHIGAWRDTARFAGTPSGITAATGRLLAADPDARTRFALAVGATAGRHERFAALGHAGDLITRNRAVDPALHDLLADRLGDDDPDVRHRAAWLLGGVPTRQAADRLAALTETDDAAVWALARLHDPRCVPALQRPRAGFTTSPVMASRDLLTFALPSIGEVLTPLREFAPGLVDGVALLPGRVRCEVLGAWQTGIEHLIPLLTDNDLAGNAAHALGEIGPAASGAAGLLTGFPWAYWRVTGDPARLLHTVAQGWDRQTMRYLGDLGPLAAGFTDRLAEATTSDDEWVRLDAARAHHRITGDPAVAAPVLTALARPLRFGECPPVAVPALEHLADIGHAGAAPIAQAVADSPVRLSYFGDWHVFATDERLLAAAHRIIQANA
ncbi:HEAT repeat domain-containing protein [Actinoplanes couchii]|uniref:PBS lyase HEAT domain protein repeat-containing protein n=1 Tax=Actinoplanes couchii TaxID=403638 RepID=A0ABQ3XM26_9ACTN|nr:HEAT repeat domain-containing protein [Actinoplanes couchii]MDR6319227.1 HEAT repeat protein [Actinoplanes couchii]GID59563.1 hypothetical protein Aco03nite_079670 [Actinoplanes couchii]